MRLGLTVGIVLATFATSGLAAAQASVPPTASKRQATFAWDDAQILRVSVSYRDVVDASIQKKLTSGLTTTIVMRGFVYRESGGDALALTIKQCRVVYDLWDEVYRITINQQGSPEKEDISSTFEGVLRRCTEAQSLPVAQKTALPSEALYVGVVVEVNPVSADMVERIRRWVSRPTSATSIAPGDALFGSFVGLFVARIGVADRQLVFRTQPFSP